MQNTVGLVQRFAFQQFQGQPVQDVPVLGEDGVGLVMGLVDEAAHFLILAALFGGLASSNHQTIVFLVPSILVMLWWHRDLLVGKPFVIAAAMVAAYIVASMFSAIGRYLPPVVAALVAGAIAVAADSRVLLDHPIVWGIASPILYTPEFTVRALLELVVPLTVTVIGSCGPCPLDCSPRYSNHIASGVPNSCGLPGFPTR